MSEVTERAQEIFLELYVTVKEPFQNEEISAEEAYQKTRAVYTNLADEPLEVQECVGMLMDSAIQEVGKELLDVTSDEMEEIIENTPETGRMQKLEIDTAVGLLNDKASPLTKALHTVFAAFSENDLDTVAKTFPAMQKVALEQLAPPRPAQSRSSGPRM